MKSNSTSENINQYTGLTSLSNSTEVTKYIIENIEQFANGVLHYPCDAIVPIEDEGLSILIPLIKEKKYLADNLIPSKAIDNDWFPQNTKISKVLLVDASARTGQTLHNYFEKVKTKFNLSDDQIDVAAFITLKTEQNFFKEFALPTLFLDANQYGWAKEAIINYLFDHVQYRWSDPPLWKIDFSSQELKNILDSITTKTNCYLFPDENQYGILRATINEIKLNDSSWLLDNENYDSDLKIRLFFDYKNNQLKILPLFFPIIKEDNFSPLQSHLEKCKPYLQDETVEELINTSKCIPNKPYYIFRWISAIGSLFLLNDFMNQILSYCPELKLNPLKIEEPIPGLPYYSYDKKVGEILETAINNLFLNNSKVSQISLSIFALTEKKESDSNENRFEVSEPYSNLKPEIAFFYHFANWFVKNEKQSDFSSLLQGLNINSMYDSFKGLSHIAIDRAIDSLTDEYIIRPLISSINGKTQRTFGPGGETVRRLFRIVGN